MANMEVRSYDLVQKDGPYEPLRVAGLAVEQGHRSCKDHGLGQLKHKRIPKVWLNGRGLQHRATPNGAWRNLRRGCYLQVAQAEQDLSIEIVESERAYLDRMHANVWKVDEPMEHGDGYHDLVVDYNDGSGALDSVELKVIGSTDFKKKFQDYKEQAEDKFAHLVEETDVYEGLILLAAKVSRAGREAWGSPELIAVRWDGRRWRSWQPREPVQRISPMQSWEALEAMLLGDAGSVLKSRGSTYLKVSQYLEKQNETDASGKVSYWKSKNFLSDAHIFRSTGRDSTIFRGAGMPRVKSKGGSQGIFVKKHILKRIHTARCRGVL